MDTKEKLAAVAGGLVVVGLVVGGLMVVNTEHHMTGCHVTNKDRALDKEGDSDARVYTSCGVFQVNDSYLALDFNSADRYNAIEVGKTYDFTTRGFRSGPLSQFPNIMESHETGR